MYACVHTFSFLHLIYIYVVGDNFAPLVSQVLNDYFLAPEYLHLPRRMLRGGDFDISHRNHGGSNPAHLRLMDDLMMDTTLGLAEADGHCFSRIVWGYGAHVLYYDTLVTMRRLVADFTHKFIQKVYKLPEPIEFSSSLSIPSSRSAVPSKSHIGKDASPTITAITSTTSIGQHQNLSQDTQFDFSGLKIVYFTRGSSGKGRTMQGEASLVRALRDRGARVLFCCDFSKATLEDQLAYAIHADVVCLAYCIVLYCIVLL